MASLAAPATDHLAHAASGLKSLKGREKMTMSSSGSEERERSDKEEISVSSSYNGSLSDQDSLASNDDDVSVDSSLGDLSISSGSDDDDDCEVDEPRRSGHKPKEKKKNGISRPSKATMKEKKEKRRKETKSSRTKSDDIPRKRHTNAPTPSPQRLNRRASARQQHISGTVDDEDEDDVVPKSRRQLPIRINSECQAMKRSSLVPQQRHQSDDDDHLPIRRTRSARQHRHTISGGSSHHSRPSTGGIIGASSDHSSVARNTERNRRQISEEKQLQRKGSAKSRSQMIKNPEKKSVLQIQLAQAVERQEKREEERKAVLSSDSESSSEDESKPSNTGKDYGMLANKFDNGGGKLAKNAKKGAKKSPFGKGIHTALDKPFIADEDGVMVGETNIQEHLNILIEIVSARNLLIADTTTSDPYVMVKLGDKDIHKTAKILKTLNPHWTPEMRSTFLLSCKAEELFDCGGLLFKLKDWDFMSPKHDPLGTVFVDPLTLLEGEGALKEYTITPPKGQEDVDAGSLSIRYRRGTQADYDSLLNNENKCLFVSIPKHLSIMIEIVSARNLLIADTTTSDPYVVVKFGDKEIHKTSKVMKTLNPDWTPELRSTFVIEFDTKDLFESTGLLFNLKDWDFIGGHDPLGSVFLNAQALCSEEKALIQEYKIVPPKGQEGADAGTLTIHYRRANEADYELCKVCPDINWIKL